MQTARCELIRWVSEEPWPGLVEAELIGAEGQVWTFIDKPPVFTDAPLDASSQFPVHGLLRCRVLREDPVASGSGHVEIETVDATSTNDQRVFVIDNARLTGVEDLR